MDNTSSTVIRIVPERAEIIVEQERQGIFSRKTVSPASLAQCFLQSRYDDDLHQTGILPENCIYVSMNSKCTYYFIRYAPLRADVTYYDTTYPDFPLPRLVFCFQYMPVSGKVANSYLCVVKDERLTMDTPTFYYPFSNVSAEGRICLGNNALPVYKDPARLGTLASYILRMPNNDDHYSRNHNQLKLEYRDLLEQMKSKNPSHYYTDLLVSNGKTLGDFINARR